MLTNKTSLELQAIARAGASLDVDGSRLTSLELQAVGRALGDSATLTVSNASKFTSLELQAIARSAPGRVHFS